MKKILLLASMLFVVLAASAQEKTLVCIEKFKNNSSVNNITMNNLRNEIMQGIIEKKRVDVTDVTSLGNLPEGKAERLKALEENNFEYLIEGTLNSVDRKKSSDDKYYIAEVNYTLTVIDVASGLTKSSDTFKDSWNIGNTAD